jgi:hypothetical protein
MRDHIRDLGIDLISYRLICDAMRRRPAGGLYLVRPPAVHDARPNGEGGLDESRRVNVGIRRKTCNHRSGQVH